jgi:hypothetical protein
VTALERRLTEEALAVLRDGRKLLASEGWHQNVGGLDERQVESWSRLTRRFEGGF